MTFHAYRLARAEATVCPVCDRREDPMLVAMYGQCGTCSRRLQRAIAKVADVVNQADVSLQFRTAWALSVLTAATGPQPPEPIRLRALPPSRTITASLT